MLGGKAAPGGRRRRPPAGQVSPSAEPGDLGKNRRVRRRQKPKKNEKGLEKQPKRYEILFKFDYYDQERDVDSGVHYISWYDQSARQKRRRSLRTTNAKTAFDQITRIDLTGTVGDPILLLQETITVGTLLRDYQLRHAGDASAGFNRVAIGKYLDPALGHILADRWRDADLQSFKNEFLKEGGALSYLSRVITVLRAAFIEAETKTKKVVRAPFIPEVLSSDDRDEAPLKGRLMTTREIASLIDAVQEPHLLQYLVGEINSASRPITILESDTSRINWQDRLFETNPPGRRQTKKYRPCLRISATWEPWLRAAPPGPLITYDGKQVRSVKKAFAAARKRADLKPDATGLPVTSYSIRHTIGRYLEDCNVPSIERSLLLGHVKPDRKKITDRYSPTNTRNPHYLQQAVGAIEQFVNEINSHTKKWDLLRPFTVKPGCKQQIQKGDAHASRSKTKSDKQSEDE
jgi:hypothetical protein